HDRRLHHGDAADQDLQRATLRLHADHGVGVDLLRNYRRDRVRPHRPLRRPAEAARRAVGRRRMRIAALQMQAVAGDAEANLARIERAAREAAAGGARLLIAPELAVTGYGAGEASRTLAEPADGMAVA